MSTAPITFKSPLCTYIYALVASHFEISTHSVAQKIADDIDCQDLRAKYNTQREWVDAVTKSLHYLKKKGYLVFRHDQDTGTQWAKAETIPCTEDDDYPPCTVDSPSETDPLVFRVPLPPGITAPKPTKPDTTDKTEPNPMNATAHTLITETAATTDALATALQNPFRIQLPDPATADRWHRVCHALAASPIMHDTIATELTAMASHFATLAPSYTQGR